MSMLIKGMEMPTEGYIDVRIKCNGTASFAIADNPYFKAVEAVPVPPHGRLGDLDKLEQMFANIDNAPYSCFDGLESFYSAEDAAQIIRLSPTVIEAEEGE